MIHLPQTGKATLRLIKKWNQHDQNYFNDLDRRTLEYILYYVNEYGTTRQAIKNNPMYNKDLLVLLNVLQKCNKALETKL